MFQHSALYRFGTRLGSPTVVVVDLSMVLDTPLLRSKRLIALLASRSKSIRASAVHLRESAVGSQQPGARSQQPAARCQQLGSMQHVIIIFFRCSHCFALLCSLVVLRVTAYLAFFALRAFALHCLHCFALLCLLIVVR